MIDEVGFTKWLQENTSYSNAVVQDTVCRAKRADKILEWDGTETYLFYLEKNPNFRALTVSVKSQLRKAIRHYSEYEEGKA